MPNVMATQPNIAGALCKSYAIPFLVPRCKVSLMPAAEVQCSNAANVVQENARLGCKVNFVPDKIPSGGKSPRKCIYKPRRRQNIMQSLVGLR